MTNTESGEKTTSEELAKHLLVVINCANNLELANDSLRQFKELISYISDLLEFGIDIEFDERKSLDCFLKGPLELAFYAEVTHKKLLNFDDNFWGTGFQIALGNFVYCLCCENGIDLDDGEQYCNKATAIEICDYNLGRLKSFESVMKHFS